MALLAVLPGVSGAAEFPLKRVVLSTSGLAQFTHSGRFTAGAAVELPVRLDQVDDVLKSLTVFDSAGAIGAVSLPGKTPLVEIFRDLPFSQQALELQSALLNALVGAEVEIEGNVIATGRVFRIEEEQVQLPNNGGQTVKHRLTLVTANGFVQAILEDVRALRFTDPQLRAQIDRALTAVAQNRAKDQRTISINFGGQGERQAGFSYVVSAPVWKTAYRLVLPKEGGNARLQGWGVLENLTGGDWKDVELTLVSGNPVALKQPLYTAVFVDRPEIPVSASARIVPRKDDAEEQSKELSFSAGLPEGMPHAKSAMRSLQAAPAPAARKPSRGVYTGLGQDFAGAGGDVNYERLEEMGSPAVKAEAEEAATQVLYRFPSKVTLASGATMMIPFVDHEIPASRTYLYQPEINAPATRRHQAAQRWGLGAARRARHGVRNGRRRRCQLCRRRAIAASAKGRHELRDIRARYQNRHPPLGHGRQASQARQSGARRAVGHCEVALDGGLRDHAASGGGPRGHPRGTAAGRLEDGRGQRENVEETPTRLRYTVLAPKGKTAKATLFREHMDYESMSLSSLAPDRIAAVISGLENQTPALKEATAKLGALASDIGKANAHRRELDTERRKIASDQDRIRKNLASTGSSSDLGRHYLDTLKGQEDRLTAIATEEKAIEQEIAGKMKEAEGVAQALVL